MKNLKLCLFFLTIVTFSIAAVYFFLNIKQSLPLAEVEVPNLVGMDFEKAKSTIRELQLSYRQPQYTCNNQYDNNVIFAQQPMGMRVKLNSELILHVSSGKCD
jgi:beta-lactam-binding protein with PASTA domain